MVSRLVFLYHSMAAHGGMERIWAEKMNYLAEHSDYTVYFITSDQSERPYSYALSPKIRHIDLGGVPFHSIYHYSYPRRLLQILKYKRDYRKRLRTVLDEIRPAIISTTNDHNIALIANWKTDAKKIIEFHLAKEFSLKVKPGRKESCFAHAWKSLYDRYQTGLLRKFDCMTVLTKTDQRQWSDVRKTVVIPNSSRLLPPISSLLPSPSSLLPSPFSLLPPPSPRIIAVGRLFPQKGFDMLIEAWTRIAERHPDWRLEIFGDGNDRDKLLGQAESLGVSQSFSIHPATDNIFDEYRKAGFLVMSSRYEGFGLVLVEAMSCGIPVVSFDCPNGPADIIRHGQNGLLVENGNTEKLAEAMERLINNPEERETMGRQAAIDAQAYSIENIGRRWIELYSRLLNSKS